MFKLTIKMLLASAYQRVVAVAVVHPKTTFYAAFGAGVIVGFII